MAKKKTKLPPGKEFSSSPFKSLKGLSVSTPEPLVPEASVPKSEPLSDEGDEPQSFVDEMAYLGVKRFGCEDDDRAIPDSVEESTVVSQAEDDGEELFREAIGQLDKVFKDEWPDGETPQAAPRRIKQVEQGRIKPERELDLHGLTRDEACDKVRFFLENACYQGVRTVLIITGKGAHSDHGPVLRQAVEALLQELRDQVVEWGMAPRRYGGGGALVVFLRKT